MNKLTPLLLLSSALLVSTPAYAASQAPAAAGDPGAQGEKLPAQLPSVTVQGQDLSHAGDAGAGKLTPTSPLEARRVSLPDPAQTRATSADDQALALPVEPSTLETPAALPGSALPYTSLLGGYGPVTQYQLGLYDARAWGPVVGVTQLDGRSGLGFSGWKGKEWLDWPELGRLHLEGNGFAWSRPVGSLTANGGQDFWNADVETGESGNFLAGLDLNGGFLGDGLASAIASPTLTSSLAAGHIQYQPAPWGDHQLTLTGLAQWRQWGNWRGPEGHVAAVDFWSISDQYQIETGLGGGYWGQAPVLDPLLAFHFRPTPDSHLFARLKTDTELPNFADLYLDQPARVSNGSLQPERVAGEIELGDNQRLGERAWGDLTVGLSRRDGHIYWADTQGSGLWTPTNAAVGQWSPAADARLQIQWSPQLSQELTYHVTGDYPLGDSSHVAGTSLEGAFLDGRLETGVGLSLQVANLSPLQSPTGGWGGGIFARASARYALGAGFGVGLTIDDLPLALSEPWQNYFAPTPLLTANLTYQF